MDQAEIIEKSLKLINALVDVISSKGYLKAALLCLELAQMITQAMWLTDSQLLQLPYFTPKSYLLENAKNQKIEDITDLMNMEDEDRANIFGQLEEKKIEEIARVCNRFPSVEVEYNIEGGEDGILQAGEPISCKVKLERDIEPGVVLTQVYAPYLKNVYIYINL